MSLTFRYGLVGSWNSQELNSSYAQVLLTSKNMTNYKCFVVTICQNSTFWSRTETRVPEYSKMIITIIIKGSK